MADPINTRWGSDLPATRRRRGAFTFWATEKDSSTVRMSCRLERDGLRFFVSDSACALTAASQRTDPRRLIFAAALSLSAQATFGRQIPLHAPYGDQ
jgi:hypothetical protein